MGFRWIDRESITQHCYHIQLALYNTIVFGVSMDEALLVLSVRALDACTGGVKQRGIC